MTVGPSTKKSWYGGGASGRACPTRNKLGGIFRRYKDGFFGHRTRRSHFLVGRA